MSVYECTKAEFTKNRAKFDGGALNCQNSTLDMSKCRFSHNVGENNAGAMWVEGSVLTATDSSWDNNQVRHSEKDSRALCA
jgi:predicted outer membrane repeat protein